MRLRGAVLDYTIKKVSDENEVTQALALFRKILSDQSRPETWVEHMATQSDFMWIAVSDNEVIGGAFGRAVDTHLLVDKVAVEKRQRGRGIARQLVLLLEENARKRGLKIITIDSTDTGEVFYSKMGYSGCLIVQSEIISVEQLLSLNDRFPVRSTKAACGNGVNQIVLDLPKPGGDLQKGYINTFPGCVTYLNYTKEL